MRAFMSRKPRFWAGRDKIEGHTAGERADMAVREARRIVAEVEPNHPDWWRQPAWDVRPLRIAGIPESCQLTFEDMPAWSALADALRAFVEEGD